MGLDSKPVRGDAATGVPPPGIRRLRGIVVRQSEKFVEVQVKNGTLKAPPDSRFRIGDKVQVVINPDGSIKLVPAEGKLTSTSSIDQNKPLVQLTGETAHKGEILYAHLDKGRTGIEYFGRIIALLAQPATTPGQIPGIPVLWKYAVETPAGQLEVNSKTALRLGDWISFSLEKSGTNLVIKQSSPEKIMPSGLASLLSEKGCEYHPVFRLAYDILAPFAQEPYFKNAVIEFGELLLKTGLFTGSKADGTGTQTIPVLSESHLLQPMANFQGPVLRPDLQQQLESLLSLFLSFPRDSIHNSDQAKLWGQVIQNPFMLLPLFNEVLDIQPDSTEKRDRAKAWSEMTENSVFRLGPNSRFSMDLALPERFTLQELHRTLMNAEESGQTDLSGKLLRFLLEALHSEASADRESNPGQYYFGFYRNRNKWRGVRLRWEYIPSKAKDKKAGLNFRIEVLTDKMGQVILDTALDQTGAELHFRHEKGEVESLLPENLKILEKELAYIDFKVKKFHISRLISKVSPPAHNLFTGIQPGEDAAGKGRIDLKA